MSYAVAEDLSAYASLLGIPVPVGGPELLAAASRDVDVYMGTSYPDPTILLSAQALALSRATCAQACFRDLQGGEDLLGLDDGVAALAGVSFTGRPSPRWTPLVAEELAGSGLVTRSGTVLPDPPPVPLVPLPVLPLP